MIPGFHNFLRGESLKWLVAILAGLLAIPAFGWNPSLPIYVAVMQASVPEPPTLRIGEKLSYSVSFGKFSNAAYAETHVVSRGALNGRDAIEIRARVKTLEMVSAAFFQVDEMRTVFAAPESGLPLYISSNSNNTIVPTEKVNNYLVQPTTSFDLVTLMYKAREAGGAGTFPLLENDQLSTVTFLPTTQERVKTDAGEFDTVISTVQSPMLTAAGIKDVKINFSTDEARVPVQVRFKTVQGQFRAILNAIALPDPNVVVEQATPTPTPVVIVAATPRPSPTPEPYVDNVPLLPEVGFQIGEVLEYAVTSAGRPAARLTFNAQERKQFQGKDSLLLTAAITSAEPGSVFRAGDAARTQVDPETLAPNWAVFNFSSALPGLRQTITFDQNTGMIKFGPPQGVDSPVGTQNLLSLFYAMRSFKLRPSKDLSNPVNDTRVAVFWENKTYVFTLRPSAAETITIDGNKVPAQLITINTLNPQLDALSIKVWLGETDRVPLRLSAGQYQADLISRRSNFPR